LRGEKVGRGKLNALTAYVSGSGIPIEKRQRREAKIKSREQTDSNPDRGVPSQTGKSGSLLRSTSAREEGPLKVKRKSSVRQERGRKGDESRGGEGEVMPLGLIFRPRRRHEPARTTKGKKRSHSQRISFSHRLEKRKAPPKTRKGKDALKKDDADDQQKESPKEAPFSLPPGKGVHAEEAKAYGMQQGLKSLPSVDVRERRRGI